jgi:hypothetical protein
MEGLVLSAHDQQSLMLKAKADCLQRGWQPMPAESIWKEAFSSKSSRCRYTVNNKNSMHLPDLYD